MTSMANEACPVGEPMLAQDRHHITSYFGNFPSTKNQYRKNIQQESERSNCLAKAGKVT